MIFWLLLHVQLISICKRNQARRKEKVIYSVPTRLLVKHSQDFHQHIHKLYLQGANKLFQLAESLVLQHLCLMTSSSLWITKIEHQALGEVISKNRI
ncbi:hypothetical protein LINPERHAP1_LOCUS40998 [Linum perenne]